MFLILITFLYLKKTNSRTLTYFLIGIPILLVDWILDWTWFFCVSLYSLRSLKRTNDNGSKSLRLIQTSASCLPCFISLLVCPLSSGSANPSFTSVLTLSVSRSMILRSAKHYVLCWVLFLFVFTCSTHSCDHWIRNKCQKWRQWKEKMWLLPWSSNSICSEEKTAQQRNTAQYGFCYLDLWLRFIVAARFIAHT